MNWTQEQRRETALAIFGMKHDWTDEPAEEKKKIALAVEAADALLDELGRTKPKPDALSCGHGSFSTQPDGLLTCLICGTEWSPIPAEPQG